MGYWTITIEGSGAHHNPAFEKDANRMADEFVKQLKAAGHDVKRAAFLFDYKGENAGDTLPYFDPRWQYEVPPYFVDLATPGPYTVTGYESSPTAFFIVQNGKHVAYWHTDQKWAIMQADHLNEAAAKSKPVSGGSDLQTTYEDRPAAGIVYRGHYIDNAGEPRTWEETYDLDLGSDVFLSWTHGQGDPQGSRPIGACIYYREPHNPSGWMCGGVTFATADPKWYTYTKEDGSKGTRPTWDVQSWEPLTITPSLLFNRSMESNGYTPKHGFITHGRWVPA